MERRNDELKNNNQIEDKLRIEARFKSGANWFFWIAGLSLVNSIILIAGWEWNFIVGLGITQFIDAVGRGFGNVGIIISLFLDTIAAGIFVLFGLLARKKYAWSFIIGMVFYAVDGLLFLIAQDWFGIAFHVLALYFIFTGLKALRKLSLIEQEEKTDAILEKIP